MNDLPFSTMPLMASLAAAAKLPETTQSLAASRFPLEAAFIWNFGTAKKRSYLNAVGNPALYGGAGKALGKAFEQWRELFRQDVVPKMHEEIVEQPLADKTDGVVVDLRDAECPGRINRVLDGMGITDRSGASTGAPLPVAG